eukprot:1162045-Pelagomonas_calceolata.AAC.7
MRRNDVVRGTSKKGNTWDDKWYDVARLIRWISAFAIQSENGGHNTSNIYLAAEFIDNLQARKQDRGRERGQPYSFYSWKQEAGEFACKRLQDCGSLTQPIKDMLIQAWREAGEKKNDAVVRKKVLEMKAMGLRV